MDGKILELFKENFEVFLSEHNDIKNKIKQETLKHVEQLVKNDKYEESQLIIESLQHFLNQLEINLNYSLVEENFNLFKQKLENPNKITQQQNSLPKITNSYKNDIPKLDNIEETKKLLEELQFQLVEEKNEELKLMKKEDKKSKFYYFTVNKPSFERSNYLEKLNEKAMNLKNIGFICYDENNLKEVIELSKEWVENNPDKRAFLSIHFTTIELLKNNKEKPFHTLSYES